MPSGGHTVTPDGARARGPGGVSGSSGVDGAASTRKPPRGGLGRRVWHVLVAVVSLGILLWWVVVMLLAILALVIRLAHAAPPPGTDRTSPISQWYRSLKQPGTGIGCCSEADCRPVATRTSNGRQQALLDGQWEDVPPRVVIEDEVHPAGQAVACWMRAGGMMDDAEEAAPSRVLWFCFVPPGAGG